MSEIPILNDMPVILTKDSEWLKENHRADPGAIMLLPEDAVLVCLPRVENVMVRADINLSEDRE